MKDSQINHTIASPKEKPSSPVPAATVLLVRDNNNKIEVFMLKRASQTNFGGAWVFPGRKLDTNDRLKDIVDMCSGLDDNEASKKLNMNVGGIHYWIACIRECFEESGILLAYRNDGEIVNNVSGSETKIIEQYRKKLLNGESLFLDMRKFDLKFTLPEVQYQDATAAMGGAIYKQKTNKLQISQLKNTQNGGRKEVVPQLQSAGAEGNKNIKGMIGALLNARIDGQGDSKATLLGGGKRKTRRKR